VFEPPDGDLPQLRIDDQREPIPADRIGMLIIDPQRSFTSGAWMKSIGPAGPEEVTPIAKAFDRCAQLLRQMDGRVETMFTRCPFPPDSYHWDERFEGIIDEQQLYFVKPGNSARWPGTNGFEQWVEGLIERGKNTLVIGGCTLNSCVRVTATETQRCFYQQGLQVVVDLSRCGARKSNYRPAALFGGRSPVQAAIDEMTNAGVLAIPQLDWA
jgi:nicotinamidase-related amidase